MPRFAVDESSGDESIHNEATTNPARRFAAPADDDETDEAMTTDTDTDERSVKTKLKPKVSAARRIKRAGSSSGGLSSEEEENASGSESASDSDASSSGASSSGASSSVSSLRRNKPPPRAMSRVDPALIPMANFVGVTPTDMALRQASLFRRPEQERELLAIDNVPVHRGPRPAHNRKHSRDSEGGTQALGQRASFGHDLGDAPYAPSSRKYARIPTHQSITKGHDGALADAGLAMGRSFRVGWGSAGSLAHLRRICQPSSSISLGNSSVVSMSALRPTADPTPSLKQLIALHMQHSSIELDSNGVPMATPSTKLSFKTLASAHMPQDRTFNAQLLRLGTALFDSLPPLPTTLPSDAAERIQTLRRRRALSAWLESAVAPTADAAARTDQPLTSILARLSGNQVEKAVDTALGAGLVHLAPLLAQAGGDAVFRGAMEAQLEVWRSDGADAHVSPELRAIYALLAGEVAAPEGPLKDWDWLRALGAHAWFAVPLDASISELLAEYTVLCREAPTLVASPAPSWPTRKPGVEDGRFALMRLYAEPERSLNDALGSAGMSATPGDVGLAWHVYVLLARCLQARDFSGREEDEGSADRLTMAYAAQLEAAGAVVEALFVILHLGASAVRQKAVKELLCRQVSHFEGSVPFAHPVINKLRIPTEWMAEAKAIAAQGRDDLYAAWEHYNAAKMWDSAHAIAARWLAPEAVIRRDMGLLKDLFRGVEGKAVRGWAERGRVYMDYARVLTRAPELELAYHSLPSSAADESMDNNDLDALEEERDRLTLEMDELARAVPSLLALLTELLPDHLGPVHCAARAEMERSLVRIVDDIRPLVVDRKVGRMRIEDEGARLRHLQASALERFVLGVEGLRRPREVHVGV